MEENPVLNNHQQIVDIETEMINNSDAVICFNENQRKFLISNYQVSNKNIFVIAQGIFVPERSFEKKNEDTISITSVGRLTVDKGIIPLIKVFQKLSKKYKNLRLNIIGEGELFKTIKEMDVVGLNLYGYLNREKLFKVLKNSDIFCSLSISESFGLSVIEAMLLGVPPIFTSGNNLPIPFSDNKSGFYIPLVEDNGKFTVDMNILEDTLERLITNNKLRQKIGDNAYRQSRKKYSLISMATNTYKIYNSIQ
jgi:glycosyltransferase involved in cell wall biosynthesis